MRTSEPFVLLTSPLTGSNLIEASAGTGKTYTITALYLRLILEQRLSVRNILVVTFTDAATEELRERIRSRLRELIDVLIGEPTKDTFLRGLAGRYGGSARAVDALKGALRDFDQAAIFTIHGFCRRMLFENAFESGSLFDKRFVADERQIRTEVISDFWRSHFTNASMLFVRYIIETGLRPEDMNAVLKYVLGKPYMEIIPDSKLQVKTALERAFMKAYKDLQMRWQTDQKEVEHILFKHSGLNRNKYRQSSVSVWTKEMDRLTASNHPNPFLFKGFEKFTHSELNQSIKKGTQPPEHPFFD